MKIKQDIFILVFILRTMLIKKHNANEIITRLCPQGESDVTFLNCLNILHVLDKIMHKLTVSALIKFCFIGKKSMVYFFESRKTTAIRVKNLCS